MRQTFLHTAGLTIALAVAMLMAGCVGPPPPAPSPRPVAVPQAPRAPVARSSDWRDWPLTPGNWRYGQGPGSSYASFEDAGRSRLSITCDASARQVRVAGMPDGTVTIRTTSLTRSITTALVPGNPPYPALTLVAQDPLLDAMAFSRGRFIVEQAGQAPLVVPPWAEIGRVIEDCRR